MSFHFYPNRTLCSVLEEMRKCYETRNFCSLLGLIEEAQSMGNRMEAALEDRKDIRSAEEYKSTLKKEIRELEKKSRELSSED